MKKSLIALAAMAAAGVSVASSRSRFDEPRGHEVRALDAGGLMANVDSATLNQNNYMSAFGNAVVATGSIALAANPTAADVLRVMRIPAGSKVSALMVANGDLDSNGAPTFVVSIGYAPCDGSSPTAAPAGFAAAGQTILQAANDGKLYCKFAPITFDKDVWLTMTVGTAAATFAAGTIYAVALGEARGIK